MNAPTHASRTPNLSAADASHLAFYEGPDERALKMSVLAPRSWTCGVSYGPRGRSLIVEPFNPGSTSSGLSEADAVIVHVYYGITSGRFTVAEYIHRLFPKLERQFVQGVVEEGLVAKEDILRHPFHGSRLTYRREDVVEFVTPANFEGESPSGDLAPTGRPIHGVVMLLGRGRELYLVVVSVRLPTEFDQLATVIIADAEIAYEQRDKNRDTSSHRRKK